ncbi:pseudouridylate synthase 7 homolog [Venturia canescens]|uniref:pseudouridylate synthase 7 homolog n=1 Tax=Venturia canescens TaxID=32260 RepID=UPI001C9CA314|nr:pseudouridylate synthase 7 homolog [Venturia canescens]
MSWCDVKKSTRGYSRYGGRGNRGNRGEGNWRERTFENENEDGVRKQSGVYRGRGGYRGKSFKRHGQGNSSYDSKRTKYKVGERLKEENVGVTEFVGSHKRFGGILKERFSDFHVNEIRCDGEICKLTNQDIPPEPEELEDLSKLKESIPAELREQLEEFSKSDSEVSITEIDVTEMNKELRRNIHTIAKKITSVVSETVERGEKKILVLAKKDKQTSHKFRGDRRVDWSRREGNYCDFLLHKVNMDTMDALNQLAAKLRIESSLFNYAGTKDRRAHTTQWVNIRKFSPKVIHDAARQVRGAFVGNFKFSKNALSLGMLKGNRFKIALRSVNATDDEIELAMQSLKNNGFINYYGLQRFGTIAAIPTHEIGKTLLQAKWKDAIDLILKPREGEQQRDMIEAREIYEKTKNPDLALRPIARSGKIEAKLLYGLRKSGENNPQGALDYIPRNARLMYIHSYQSFVWNHMVSKRIKEFGAKPIVGDLVYDKTNSEDNPGNETMDFAHLTDQSKEPKDGASDAIEEETIPTKLHEKHSIDDEQCIEDRSDEIVDENETKIDNGDETPDDSRDPSSLPNVKSLSEEDLDRYTIADVVMPKPGWKVTYPSYAKAWFDEFLARDDLTTDLRQKNKKYSLGGGYRKILETAEDLSWKIVRYDGYHDDLIASDIDEMRKVEAPKIETEGKHKALILEFSLNPSTYATMALREILEHDTSAQAQALQSTANQALENVEKIERNDQPDIANEEIVTEDNGSSVDVKNEEAKDNVTVDTNETEAEIIQNDSPQKNPESADADDMEISKEDVNIPYVDEKEEMETDK